MLKNLIRISLRLVKRNRTYSIINFFGLSLGLFAFILIYVYVSYELRYDRYHHNYENLYKVYKQGENEYMGSNKFAVTQAPLAGLIQQLPEVDHTTRILSSGNLLVTVGKESFFEDKYYAVGPYAFNMFTLDIAAGSKKGMLTNPKSVVLNETMAIKYFGSAENAIGKTIRAESYTNLGEFVVESVVKDMPANSQFSMNIIFQFEATVNIIQPGDLTSWDNSNYYNYVMFKPGADISAAEAKLMESVKSNFGDNKPPDYKFQPLRNAYLGERLNFDIGTTGSMNRIYIFLCIGILVLLIACINYTNMATARASKRAKEIGLRKVTGASRSELMMQFIGEAVFMSTLSMVVAYGAVILVLPYFNSFLDKNILLSFQAQPLLIVVLAGLALLVGVIAGIYPALVLSSMSPVQTLKGSVTSSSNISLRDALVVFQFVISGTLIFATLVVWNQLQFIEHTNLGFNKEQIVTVKLRDRVLQEKAGAIKQMLLQNPDILKVSASSRTPSQVNSNQGRNWDVKGEQKSLQVYYCEIDSSFLNVYEIKLLAGQNLSATSDENDVIINESLVKELGYTNEEIIGTLFAHGDSTRVIGVVQDFHFQDFRQKIQPLRMKNFVWGPPSCLSLKVNEAGMQRTLQYVEETLSSISDKYPFEYAFYDDIYNRAYVSEIKTGKMMGWFAGVAIFIATMGLYGLVLFVLNQRLREISIRKVLGASGISILRLLSSRFVVLVMIGYALACGIGYYGMEQWLSEFVYRIPLSFGIFLVTLVVMIAITGLTIFFRVRQATSINPAVVLKQE